MLLGAGASTPFIGRFGNRITTSSIVDALIDRAIWQYVVDRFVDEYLSETPNAIIAVQVDEVCALFERIIDSIRNHFREVSFDQVLHVAEPVCLRYSSWPMDDFENYSEELLALFNTYTFASNRTSPDAWRYVPYLAREVICCKIGRVWNLRRNQKHFFIRELAHWLSFVQRRFSMNMFSFNYDELFGEVIRNQNRILTAYERGAFDKNLFWNAPEVYCQLHGATKLYSSPDGHFMAPTAVAAATIRLRNSSTHIAANTFKYADQGSIGTHYNTWLISSLEKMEAFAQVPFSTYFYRLGRDIAEAEVTLAIGTSLGDIHINAYISNIVSTLGKTIVFVTKTSLDAFLGTLASVMFSPQNDLLTMIVRTNASLSSRGFSIAQGIQFLKQRLRTEYRSRGFVRLGAGLYLCPDGSYRFFKDPSVLVEVLKAIRAESA